MKDFLEEVIFFSFDIYAQHCAMYCQIIKGKQWNSSPEEALNLAKELDKGAWNKKYKTTYVWYKCLEIFWSWNLFPYFCAVLKDEAKVTLLLVPGIKDQIQQNKFED